MHNFNEPIDEEFEKMYLFFQQGKFILDASFRQSSIDFFNKYNNAQTHWEIHDQYFENFGPLWYKIESGRIAFLPKEHIEKTFDKILDLVYEWEDRNSPHKIHKGTIYYFYGVICILNGEIEKGNLYMHQASNEDGNLSRRDTPSKKFISLDDGPNQFFQSKVIETISFLQKFINEYNSVNSSSFSMAILRSKFLTNNTYTEEAFFFVYFIYKLESIYNRINIRIRENRLASFIETTIVFELSKLFEVLLRKIYSEPTIKTHFSLRQKPGLIHYVDFLCQDSSINLRLCQTNLGFLNSERDNNFSALIVPLINRTYSHNTFIASPSRKEYNLALTYVLRNFGGHTIEDQDALRSNFDEIIKSILNSIFLVIENKL